MSVSENAISALRTALENTPDDHDLALHLANLLLETESYAEALPLFQQVLTTQPNNVKALRGAWQAADKLGKENLAVGYKQLLSALEPTNSDIKFNNESTDETGNVQNLPQRTRQAELRLVKGGEDISQYVEVEDSEVFLKDVGGMEQVKRRLHLSFLGPIKNPQLMKTYGKSLGGGFILYGPPGCGKTFIARALAGELGAKFISVGLSDVVDMWFGESERKLHELFETARRAVPAVLFIDELDALGQKRSHLKHSSMRNVVNQLLAELDSLGNDNTNLFMLAATNHPWDVDAALRRPGRFDRMIAVFPPDPPARQAILQYHLRNKPIEDLDLELLVTQTKFFSGADLAYLCNIATEYVIEECMETGQTRPLTTEDFYRPIKEVRPTTKAWFEVARNYAMFANEGGTYDDLLEYIHKAKL
ncbi:MAG: ATP-binding protein [Candidatus Parabeggiatoa sp. nov. 2]|nr:MAG: ATP-binding protein [Gammaproteobacteria bacterium]